MYVGISTYVYIYLCNIHLNSVEPIKTLTCCTRYYYNIRFERIKIKTDSLKILQ